MLKWGYLAAGGLIGTFARYLLSGFVYKLTGTEFPYGTLMVNLIGCFCVGFIAALSDEKLFLGPDMRVFLIAGFCGAFTTFSTFMMETAHLIKVGDLLRAFGNISLSLVIGFLLFRLGVWLGELL